MNLKKKMKQGLKKNVLTQYGLWFRTLCQKYKRTEDISMGTFEKKNLPRVFVFKAKSVAAEFCQLLSKVDIEPVESDLFFYSIDCYKTLYYSIFGFCY